jgi:hypothetical protein
MTKIITRATQEISASRHARTQYAKLTVEKQKIEKVEHRKLKLDLLGQPLRGRGASHHGRQAREDGVCAGTNRRHDSNRDRQDNTENDGVLNESRAFFIFGEFLKSIQQLTHNISLQLRITIYNSVTRDAPDHHWVNFALTAR